MTTIYLIRHAEAEGNLYRRIQGHWNGQITPRGREQIDALAAGVAFNAVHAGATVLFLALIGQPMLKKLDRVKVKYGLMEEAFVRENANANEE